MIRTIIIPLLAVIGVIMAAATVVKSSKPIEATPPVISPPSAPFEAFVAGSGLVEASSRNVAIGTPVGGIVAELLVGVNDSIAVGAPLFRIDTRDLEAQRGVMLAQIDVARAQLARLEAGTRPESIPPARARVAEAEANLADAESALAFREKIADTRAITQEELTVRRFAVAAARTRLEQSRADVALLEAGTWSVDLAVARAQLALAQSNLATVDTEITRRTVTSPITGRVLQVNVRAGEFASAANNATPLLLVGSVDPLHVRVDIDEHEAWRITPGAEAIAFVKGNKDLKTPLTFIRFEPYVVPKRSLTGDSTERVDTRVLQVIYAFPGDALPVFVGQQMDVYIKSAPLVPSASAPAPHTTN